MTRRRSLLNLALFAATVLPTAGCLDHPLKDVSLQSEGEIINELQVDTRRKVDILFVIDDSGSMGEEQAALAANFSAFVEVLEDPDVDADYRIGITTTDNGHPGCWESTPEGGALQLRSCRTHIDDFVFSPNTNDEIDRREEACLETCPEALADLTTLPSWLDPQQPGVGDERARPWLERGRGRTNVPEGVTTAQALGCWGPQGINGCGYESPLESMHKALRRSSTDGEDGQGFLREDALLQVVFITDEADCSTGPSALAAFDPDGDKTLWPDPDAARAPSAVCWNAGVSCESTADGRTHCEPVDLGPDGSAASVGNEVLQPIDRYLELLHEIDEAKRLIAGQDEPQVLVSVIAGVPNDYDGRPLDYDTDSSSEFAGDFGVGAGCTSDNGEAVPPVRLRAVADAFTDEVGANLFSICDANYRPALEAIADILLERLRPSCINACVRGATEIIDGDLPTCTVVHEVDGTSNAVATCLRGDDGEWVRPEGESLCVYAVTDDERHADCRVADRNVELRFIRDPNALFGDVSAACEISNQPYIDCPDPDQG